MKEKMLLTQCLVYILCSIIPIVNSDATHNDERLLKDSLLSNYRNDIKPVVNLSKIVDIDIYMRLYTLYDLDFINNLLIARYLLAIRWKDEHLSWKPPDYNNITNIHIPREKLWIPNAVMCNSMTKSEDKDNLNDVSIAFDGYATMVSFILLQTYCHVNAYTYPFDEHKCAIRICAATYGTNLTTFILYVSPGEENHKWYMGIIDHESYGGHVNGTVYLRRKPTVGTIAMLIPTVMMSILTVFVFILPPESGEKVSLATTIFLSNVLYLAQMDKNTPANSKYPSLLMLYLMVLSLVSGIATLGSVIISKLYVIQSLQEKDPNLREESKQKSQRTISIVSTENLEALKKARLEREKKREFIGYIRLDVLFLKLIIAALVIISITFTSLLFSPLD